MPVRRRHDGGARAHRIGQRAARDLCLVEVRADEHVGRLQVLAQLVGGDELAAKRRRARARRASRPRARASFDTLRRRAARRRDAWRRRRSRRRRGSRARPPAARESRFRCPCWRSATRTSAASVAPPRRTPLSALVDRVGRSITGMPCGMIRTFEPLTPYELSSRSFAIRLMTTICGAELEHLPHDRRLVLRRALEHRVERDHHGHAQRADEIEDVAAVVAAEYRRTRAERRPMRRWLKLTNSAARRSPL